MRMGLVLHSPACSGYHDRSVELLMNGARTDEASPARRTVQCILDGAVRATVNRDVVVGDVDGSTLPPGGRSQDRASFKLDGHRITSSPIPLCGQQYGIHGSRKRTTEVNDGSGTDLCGSAAPIRRTV